MGNLANKLNKAYVGDVKQTLKAISQSKELRVPQVKIGRDKQNILSNNSQNLKNITMKWFVQLVEGKCWFASCCGG
ncbi:hypothetical protein L3X38_024729 [Prunus dulcis]|uniref:Uncharacterized protein n=1 Tax=Prunus dulcis TaxID=3755 RepID=A0AAD4Z6P1_PRUDU|nr:hypothetical protein L3X38_024729 [Prunus dulcis]